MGIPPFRHFTAIRLAIPGSLLEIRTNNPNSLGLLIAKRVKILVLCLESLWRTPTQCYQGKAILEFFEKIKVSFCHPHKMVISKQVHICHSSQFESHNAQQNGMSRRACYENNDPSSKICYKYKIHKFVPILLPGYLMSTQMVFLESQTELTKIVNFLLVTYIEAWVIFFVTVSRYIALLNDTFITSTVLVRVQL